MAVTKRVRKKKIFYHAKVYVRGVRTSEKTFSSKTQAYVWHDEEKKRWLEQRPTVVEAAYLFEECLRDFREDLKSRVRLSSLQSFDARWRYFSEAPISKIRMEEFTDKTVDLWLEWLLGHPSKDNPGRKSFQHELKHLSVILNWYRNDRDPSFVVPIVKRHRQRCNFKPVTVRRPDYYMRPAEVRQWLQWLKANRSDPVYHRLAKFMVLTGVRVGEACGMHWDAIDLEQGSVRIVRTVSWDHNSRVPRLMQHTKTEESIRVLPIPGELTAMLKQMPSDPFGPVFHRNGELLRYNAIQSAFNAGFRACGLPWRSTHILRHTYGTLALKATGNLSAVQASLGHRSRSVTERYAKSVVLLEKETATKTATLLGLGDPASSPLI